MRALILVAGAALAVAACSSKDNANNTMNVDENLTTTTDTNMTDMNMDTNAADANMTMNGADMNASTNTTTTTTNTSTNNAM
jgi:hypothetical protein